MNAWRVAALLLSVWELAACEPTVCRPARGAEPTCARADEFLVADFPFDGDLRDASGKSHHAAGQAGFAEGQAGQACRFRGEPVAVPDGPDLRLAPGLTIDCWVYFDEKPVGYQTFVLKENEYQLRLDDLREGGRFSFFVHLDGWEPRVSTTVPVPGKWYHLRAKWTGTEIRLAVNGACVSAERFGTPTPTDNPLVIGGANCRIDQLSVQNPGVEKTRQMREMIEEAADAVAGCAGRGTAPRFGGGDGWQGWRGTFGAKVSPRDGALVVEFSDENAMLLNPALDVDAAQNPWVSVHLRSQQVTRASLTFVTDAGSGVATLPVWDSPRTCLVNLAHHPAWRGRLKLLGLSLPEGGQQATIEGLWVSARPEGRPFLYVRNLAPGRAILRAGRDEPVIAVVRNLGSEASRVRAELRVPDGVRIVGQAAQSLDAVPYRATERFEWTVRAERPLAGEMEVLVAEADGLAQNPPVAGKRLAVRFEPPPVAPKADYVPPPQPAPSRYLGLMHYCPLWKVGTHEGWERIENWPERRPAIGWYDEGSPEVADWHIKYALEHGIQGFIYCWYRADFSPEIRQSLGHALHDGMLKAKYLDQFRFAIMWENGCAKGVKDRDDLLRNVLPYWLDHYFTHPSYVKIDNKPVLFVWRPERVGPELGGAEGTRQAFEAMRAACRARGLEGLWIVGCVETANEGLLRRLAEEGWDATSAYATWSQPQESPTIDLEGIPTFSNRARLLGQKDVWLGKKAVAALPDIVSVMQGWDPRPWHGAKTRAYWADPSPEHFREACLEAKRILDATPGNGLDKRLVVFDNWDEFGEGHYLEPTAGFGFQYVDVIREVFCTAAHPCRHVIPEDVGLEPPERWYRQQREILGTGVRKVRKVVDGLLAWWTFDDDPERLARDRSACHFDGVKQGATLTEGVRGKGLRCDGGTVAVGPHELLSPSSGITVALWLRADEPNQEDRWILNTVGAADTGYRLGMARGRLGWQIPQEPWSHLLVAPDRLPPGRWTHVAATYDGRAMRLYVDGKLKGELPRAGAIRPSEAKLVLGSYGQSDRRHNFIGAIDEVKLYDRALSEAEIAEDMRPDPNSSSPTATSAIVDGSGTAPAAPYKASR